MARARETDWTNAVRSRQVVAIGCAMRAFAKNCHDGTGPRSVWVASRVARATYGVSSPLSFRQLVAKVRSGVVHPAIPVPVFGVLT